jgi:hypothetical protein
MYQRRVSEEEVRNVLAAGETVEEYPDDLPYPSRTPQNGKRILEGERNHEVRGL